MAGGGGGAGSAAATPARQHPADHACAVDEQRQHAGGASQGVLLVKLLDKHVCRNMQTCCVHVIRVQYCGGDTG